MEIKSLVSFVVGTRPEAIKLAPVIKQFQKSDKLKIRVLLTGQHTEMVYEVMKLFEIQPSKNLNLMKKNQSLIYITESILNGIQLEFREYRPKIVFVQGDTTSAFAAALAAFYEKIPIAHVEAGLRSGNKFDPYPEEANRRLLSQIASLHFAPTEISLNNLISEGIKKDTYLTGNTIIDSLKIVSKRVKPFHLEGFDLSKKDLILATLHRRENWGEKLNDIAIALKKIVDDNLSTFLLLPLHKNPVVRETLKKVLEGNDRIFLAEPLAYDQLVAVLKCCKLVITDSGGLQEEAPTFGKPVLVVRNNTERLEAINAGCAKLIGTDKENIYKIANLLLNNSEEYNLMAKIRNPFGNGDASTIILKECLNFLDIQ